MFEVIFWFTHPYDYRQDCLMLVHVLARDSAGAAAALADIHGPGATIHSIVRVCEGHTRIPAQLCAAQDDLVLTRYDHLGMIEKKHLCPDCRGRILDGPPHAWFHD